MSDRGPGPSAAPLPPFDLALRVGHRRDHTYEDYLATGRRLHDAIVAALPTDWTFPGKRVLDFGCGAGRSLRHFLDVAETAEIWGCDIDADSVEWVRRNLSPPLRCFRNRATPPLEVEDGYFDLVWAMSVFTHIDEGWADWLLEIHRVLAPGGLLVSSYMGPGTFERFLDEPYREDEVGMLVRHHGRALRDGGALVFHSEWWLRAHWGRAFDILEVRRPGPGKDASAIAHCVLLARRRESAPTPAALDRIDDADPREAAALRTQVRMLRVELEGARAEAGRGLRSLARRAGRLLARTALGPPARRLRRRLRGAMRSAKGAGG